MGLRKTEIDQHTVAEVFGHVTVEAVDHLRADLLVFAQDMPHVLRIQKGRQFRRPREIAEHHSQLPALWSHRSVPGGSIARFDIVDTRSSFQKAYAVSH